MALGALVVAWAVMSCAPQSNPQDREADAPVKVESNANRLIRESSPYLLLHAHNPVDWYPWGEEAVEKARKENKPIFLSIGYSTCYWCHVMEREVFSNPAIAELMNQWFVNIKVDREERPELDDIYMTATQLITQSGGWPNSVFLTPELKPFFAGTYFPPDDQSGRPGFPRVLRSLHDAWTGRRPEVLAQAEKIAEAMRQLIAERREPASAVLSQEAASRAVAELKTRYNPEHGGFGGPPNFPSPANLYLLWEQAERGDADARQMVLETLRKMGRGAMYDQLGGGFHRYTLDARWRVPHFEKMLYDNAHLAEILSAAAKETGDSELGRLARGTLDFVLREMTLPERGFKSAIDAETDGEEGAYYIWTSQELREVLGGEGFSFLAPILGFAGPPNFEGAKHTLYLPQSLEERAGQLKVSREELLRRIEPMLEKLRQARQERKFPLVDDKVLTDWNGMMIAAMARSGKLLGETRYLEAAGNAALFLLDKLRGKDGTLLHTWRLGEARIPAFLDDYAFLIRGLLALDEATGEPRWLREAEKLAEEMERRLRDPQGGYYLSEAKSHLLFQPKTATDGALPSGNGVAILDLLRLGERTGRAVYRERAEAALRAFATEINQYPVAVPTLALGLLRYHEKPAPSLAPYQNTRPSEMKPAGQLANDVLSAKALLSRPPLDGGWRRFELRLTLREGWHINANPASMKFLIPTRIEGKIRNVRYPRGEILKFSFAEEELAVYSGEVSIAGEVGPGESSLRLTYQACDDSRCLPPFNKTVKLPSGN